ncbi:hypothetical protein OAO87_02900, partial [bacterium]|nr:hypothetical protein [bacterium]
MAISCVMRDASRRQRFSHEGYAVRKRRPHDSKEGSAPQPLTCHVWQVRKRRQHDSKEDVETS